MDQVSDLSDKNKVHNLRIIMCLVLKYCADTHLINISLMVIITISASLKDLGTLWLSCSIPDSMHCL